MSPSKPLPMTPEQHIGALTMPFRGLTVVSVEAVPKDTAFIAPGPMPTDTNAADTERWSRGVLRVGLSPAEQWYALRSTPLTPKGRNQ